MAQPVRSITRAESMAQTRGRIIRAARELLPETASIPVDTIAERAGVSVQTLYSHFGSKRGLLLAVIDDAQQDAGVYADLDAVWRSPDGETALRQMIAATVRIWDGAWDVVESAERARRSDAEMQRHLREIDGYRRSNLVSITERLGAEGRLRPGLDPVSAADLAFALSVPAVYEELVKVRSWPLAEATLVVVRSVVGAVVDPETTAISGPPADWSSALRAEEATRGSRA